ncbi:Transmembrane 9 superfamily member [Quillaja saponaria]|uniref:Transmembrane 9 superfamily member n=1 Tax=Quillaja saponaria TaxID=32244 RepID=A0AAD7VD34_QUISA|nr:Transmembrane 9 superfamily member [Quillaja saponaria]
MYYDSILLQGAVGKVVKYVDDPSLTPRYYLYNHIRFLVYYLENQVKDIVLMREYGSWADITEDAEIIGLNFSYTLLWYKIQPGRINAPLLDQISCPDIDWYWPQAQEPKGWEVVLSFMYSASSIFIWVAFLLAVTMPYLTNYFTRYSQKALVDDRGMSRVNGIHRGTACKCPAYSSLLGAVLGIGSQIFIMIFTFFGLAFIFKLNPCNPKVVHFVLFMTYGLTSPVAGYIATSFHYKFTRVGWKECIFQTGVLFLVPAMLTTVVVNGLAVITYGTSEVPEFLDIAVSVFFTFAFLLHCLGGVIAYHFRPKHAPSCTTKRFPTEISLQPWFLRTSGQMLLGGLLPFTVIFWQMDNVYASLWNRKVCGAFQAMVTCSFVVVTMTIMVGIVFTGYQLSRKDHHWWWRSVLRGGSTAIFMFVYGIYFHSRTRTEDFMKFLLFMGYNACIFYAFFLALGAIGYWASSFVFRRMYHNLQKYE